MDVLTKEQRRLNMQAIKSTGTKIEILLAKALWARGYRYRKNCKTILGKPDIVFRKKKIAIFCDSEFWHGKDYLAKKKKFYTNKKYWNQKIESNIKRDKFVNHQLKKQGWIVLRFWAREIEKTLEHCMLKIEKTVAAK
ncbi:MAG: very short patch repair endonuclease [Endomicrobia bacterium]|nr:very short patch repair endonuclease [Endomicrobiia bacterium]MCL2506979.1 very short patch repair endonuclease [Endomicrobiia bacterium]